MIKRRVLITGAGGFVGRALATGFADLGWGVVGIDRAFDDAWIDDRIERIVADLEGGLDVDLPSGVPGADVVVHAAWITTDPATLGVSQDEYTRRNLGPLMAMLQHASRTEPEAFVFLSSSGVFGSDDGSTGLTDTDVPTGDSPYAKAKLRAEQLVMDGVAADTTEAHVVRLGYLFGPGEAARPTRPRVSLVASWLEAARSGRPLEVRADDPAREWTFAPDLADALGQVVESGSAGRPIHFGSAHVMRDSRVAGLIAAHVPGAEVVTVSAGGRVKPPMIPSDVPALRDFAWTDVHTGLRALVAADGPDGARVSARTARERSA